MLLLIVAIIVAVILAIKISKRTAEEERIRKSSQQREEEWRAISEDLLKQRMETNQLLGLNELAAESQAVFDSWSKDNQADLLGYSIAGISFRGLDRSHLGVFEGKLKREENNKHDPNAIAIYRGSKKVGYIPRYQNTGVLDALDPILGVGKCKGCIYLFIDDDMCSQYAGKVVIDWPLDEAATGQNRDK